MSETNQFNLQMIEDLLAESVKNMTVSDGQYRLLMDGKGTIKGGIIYVTCIAQNSARYQLLESWG